MDLESLNIIFIVAPCMLIVLSPLFVQLMHTNHYKIVKQLKSFKITIVAPTCFGLHKSSLRIFFNVLLTVHFSIFILVINQLDAQNICFTISLFRSLYMFRARPPIGVLIPEAV